MSLVNNIGLKHFYDRIKAKFIQSVNSQTPDQSGNVNITTVATAENLVSPDAQTSYDTYIYRTSGGSASLNSGEAELMYIDGNIEVVGRVIENFNIIATNNINVIYNADTWRSQISTDGSYVFSYLRPTSSAAAASWTASGTWSYNGSTVQLSTYGLTVTNIVDPSINVNISGAGIESVTVVPSTFGSQMPLDGTYMFTFDNEATSWQYNGQNVTLSTYGLATTGTPQDGDTIYVNYIAGTANSTVTVNYTAPQQGTIYVATPDKFSATGFNQFDKDTMYLQNASVSGGKIVQNSGTNVCYCKAKGSVTNGYMAYSPGGYIIDIGWCANVPALGSDVVSTGSSVTSELASISFGNDGYVIVVASSMTDLCIHPKWSGSADTDYAAYVAPSQITIPTIDIEGNNLPTAIYGMPRVQGFADRLNLESGTYIQKIGRMENTTTAMAYVVGLGVPYDYDANYIYYVLPEQITYTVLVDPIYTVNDWGTEEFTGTTVAVGAQTLYGQNLRDKLRTDVLTISAQTPSLTSNQRQQVLSNIGISNISNPNLLDNWYFVGGGSQSGDGKFPINQRGLQSYSASTSSNYSINRWYFARGSVSISNTGNGLDLKWNGIDSSNIYFQQKTMQKLGGKVLTATILFADGTLITGTNTQTTTGSSYTEYVNNGTDRIYCTTSASDDITFFTYNTTRTTAKTIAAFKLELGSTQTLAHQENGIWVLNEIPDYSEQLMRCCSSTADTADIYANKPYNELRIAEYKTAANLSALQTLLSAEIASMVLHETKRLNIQLSASFDPFAGGVWLFELTKEDPNYWSAIASSYGGYLVQVQYLNGTWQYKSTGNISTGTNASSLVVPTATYTTISSVTLTPGTWLIIGGHQWTSSFDNMCIVQLAKSDGGYVPAGVVRYQINAGGGVNVASILSVTSNTVINMNAYQASGTDRTASGVALRAIRII